MNVKPIALFALIALPLAAPAAAQLAVPDLGQTIERPVAGVTGALDTALGALDTALGALERTQATAAGLARARLDRIDRLVRANRAAIERDSAGEPARRGELLVLAPPAELDPVLRGSAFTAMDSAALGELGITVTRVAVPAGVPLAAAERQLRALLPGMVVSADTLHFQSGRAAAGPRPATAPGIAPIDAAVGMIDGGIGAGDAAAAARGFARGAPLPSAHGSAVASLLRYAGVRRITAADVYGDDPAGGNALAIARALDWLVGRGVRVIGISLVGPANPLLAQAIGAAQRRGAVVVAAVGNDGPAAPPAYPASYPGVIAVTATDGRNRALIEAGRALHLDYAAPGADMVAADAAGRMVRVRGTSFAVPLVAARAAAAGPEPIAALDREAIDLGPRGADRSFGRGLLCAACRRTR